MSLESNHKQNTAEIKDLANDVVNNVEEKLETVKEQAKPAAPTRSIGNLFANISNQISTLFRGEIELAKAEAVAKVTKMGKGGALFAVVGVIALFLLIFILHTVSLAIGQALRNLALGYLITSGILLVLIIILSLVGVALFKSSKKNVIDPVSGLKESAAAFAKGVKKNKEENK